VACGPHLASAGAARWRDPGRPVGDRRQGRAGVRGARGRHRGQCTDGAAACAGNRRDRGRGGRLRACRDACRSRRLRHGRGPCRQRLPAAAVPLDQQQPAHRPLRRHAREPRADRAGGGGCGGGRTGRRPGGGAHVAAFHRARHRRRAGRGKRAVPGTRVQPARPGLCAHRRAGLGRRAQAQRRLPPGTARSVRRDVDLLRRLHGGHRRRADRLRAGRRGRVRTPVHRQSGPGRAFPCGRSAQHARSRDLLRRRCPGIHRLSHAGRRRPGPRASHALRTAVPAL